MSMSITWWLAPVLVAVAGLAFRRALTVIRRHSVYLYGHRVDDGEPARYRFAIQNAENIPLQSDMCARITIAGDSAGFQDEPEIYAGPRIISAGGSTRNRWFRFDRLPAFDTWVISCRISGAPREVSFELFEVDEDGSRVERRNREVAVETLRLLPSGPALDVAGRSRVPIMPLAVWSVLTAAATYVAAVGLLFIGAELQEPVSQLLTDRARLTDLGFVAGLSLLCLVLIRFTSRPSARAIQGYLEPTVVRREG